uniref:FAD/NAD(P)-binding protein n=1 Tax=Saccharopolyspora galaxeae TaxID=2781241 RepID=UPI0027DBB310|nr:FAD/NAD(P)-binding protein [Saccharopolyspora sp. HNM0986]
MRRHIELCIVGCGPRGTAVLERMAANAVALEIEASITVHAVDAFPPGPGKVWRVDQSGELLMNTVSSQVTLFTDDSVVCDGPIRPGPSLYEWAQAAHHDQHDEQNRREIAELGPDDYPTRRLYGRYLRWFFERAIASAPPNLRVQVHQAEARELDDEPDGSQTVLLSNDERLRGLDAVVLAQGHRPAEPTAQEQQLRSFADEHGLTYLSPANPADLHLDDIPASETVLLRGMGLNFFDHMALFTAGRGGRFEPDGDGLRYRPSGNEPHLVAGTRRGVPYHARAANQKGAHGRYFPRLLTDEVIADFRRRADGGDPPHFRTDVWPLVDKEIKLLYYTTLLRERAGEHAAVLFEKRFLHDVWQSEQELLYQFGIARGQRWSWDWIAKPYGDRVFSGRSEFRDWLLGYLRADVAEAAKGNVSGPLKAALDAMRDLRNEIRLIVDHGGISGTSYRDELKPWFTPLTAFVSIGPPMRRIQEMIALIEAGVLEVLPPGVRVDEDSGAFRMSSAHAPEDIVRGRNLIEARLPEPGLRGTADPLLRHLAETGQCRRYEIGDPSEPYLSNGLAVSGRPFFLQNAHGQGHPARFAFGVPIEAVNWVTAAGARPGVNSVSLSDADAVARGALSAADTRRTAEAGPATSAPA